VDHAQIAAGRDVLDRRSPSAPRPYVCRPRSRRCKPASGSDWPQVASLYRRLVRAHRLRRLSNSTARGSRQAGDPAAALRIVGPSDPDGNLAGYLYLHIHPRRTAATPRP